MWKCRTLHPFATNFFLCPLLLSVCSIRYGATIGENRSDTGHVTYGESRSLCNFGTSDICQCLPECRVTDSLYRKCCMDEFQKDVLVGGLRLSLVLSAAKTESFSSRPSVAISSKIVTQKSVGTLVGQLLRRRCIDSGLPACTPDAAFSPDEIYDKGADISLIFFYWEETVKKPDFLGEVLNPSIVLASSELATKTYEIGFFCRLLTASAALSETIPAATVLRVLPGDLRNLVQSRFEANVTFFGRWMENKTASEVDLVLWSCLGVSCIFAIGGIGCGFSMGAKKRRKNLAAMEAKRRSRCRMLRYRIRYANNNVLSWVELADGAFNFGYLGPNDVDETVTRGYRCTAGKTSSSTTTQPHLLPVQFSHHALVHADRYGGRCPTPHQDHNYLTVPGARGSIKDHAKCGYLELQRHLGSGKHAGRCIVSNEHRCTEGSTPTVMATDSSRSAAS